MRRKMRRVMDEIGVKRGLGQLLRRLYYGFNPGQQQAAPAYLQDRRVLEDGGRKGVQLCGCWAV